MEKKISITILNTFSIDNGLLTLKDSDFHSNKIIKFLIYLILNSDRAVSKTELSDTIFAQMKNDTSGALKNLVYRTRCILKTIEAEDLVQTITDGYRINPEYEITTDLQEYVSAARDVLMEKEKMDSHRMQRLCETFMKRYSCEISPRAAQEEWIKGTADKLTAIYMEIAKMLCKIYVENGRWKKLEALSKKLITYQPLDEELHAWMIMAFNKQRKVMQAMQHYEEVRKLLYAQCGQKKPQKIIEAFEQVEVPEHINEYSIIDVIDELTEAEIEIGAYCCDYQMFRQIYQVERRREYPPDTPAWILTVSVHYRNKNVHKDIRNDKWFLEKVESLELVLKRYLRAGDIVSRYNLFQYIVLIPGCTLEDVSKIIDRIQDRFTEKTGYTVLGLDFEKEKLDTPSNSSKGELA